MPKLTGIFSNKAANNVAWIGLGVMIAWKVFSFWQSDKDSESKQTRMIMRNARIDSINTYITRPKIDTILEIDKRILKKLKIK
jgi:hypothetical protein